MDALQVFIKELQSWEVEAEKDWSHHYEFFMDQPGLALQEGAGELFVATMELFIPALMRKHPHYGMAGDDPVYNALHALNECLGGLAAFKQPDPETVLKHLAWIAMLVDQENLTGIPVALCVLAKNSLYNNQNAHQLKVLWSTTPEGT